MSYQEPIYNQNGSGERNQTVPVVNTSSDICVFAMPIFTMSGASKIDCTGTTLTTGSTNVYSIVSGQTNIDVEVTFTANTSSLTGTTDFRYEVYKYNKELGLFSQPALYRSPSYEWSSYSATSAFTSSIPVNNLNIDGDYLIKGFYIHDVCTEFASLLGSRYSTYSNITGDEYGIYQDDRDAHFVAFTPADIPLLNTGSLDQPEPGSLLVTSYVLDGLETTIALPETTSSYLIALNGLTLSKDFDYTLSSNTVTTYATLSGVTVSGDMLTYAYMGTSSSASLRDDNVDITSPIVSGVTNGEGSNDVYYNTTEGKYEFYTSMTPIDMNNFVFTLNGATLANNIDYYQSTTNPKRIILEGELYMGDIIGVYYITDIAPQGNTQQVELNLNWVISTPPQTTGGTFTTQIADSNDFTNVLISGTTDYIIDQVSYGNVLPLSGTVGTTLYYRVKNDKNYTDMCGTDILTTAYSDIIDITIQTNASNSY